MPRRADGTLLPAALALALSAMAAGQMLLTAAPDLPSAGVVGGGGAPGAIADPPIPGSPPAASIARMFAPAVTGGESGSAGGPADPLGGHNVLGTIAVGGARMVIVSTPEGGIRRIPRGGMVAGWRLVGANGSGAVFARGGERLVRPFGAQDAGSAVSAAPQDASIEDQ